MGNGDSHIPRLEGRSRMVSRSGTFTWTLLPRIGDLATIWLDPDHPDDPDSAVVAVNTRVMS
ncbi:hypothetical protein BBK82_07395 [Lentzea guizhouensis]|uniref:Uncharacterized protein n=1 Tax=Lentzea guizhouensis TaxID=1586287 RepID=A0A1B2HE13_9PSEU|nr:hypothetical protein [Lentzea guizhouensis]ANZ35932.1 hypothetical protein BBK82_07395 [Lentzea guizhouensis]